MTDEELMAIAAKSDEAMLRLLSLPKEDPRREDAKLVNSFIAAMCDKLATLDKASRGTDGSKTI